MTEQYKREVAYRIFSDELRDSVALEKGGEEYAAQFVLTPTGAKANRIFVVGTLTEKEDIGTDSAYFKLVIADPKGTFKAYIGMYQEEALASIANIEPPCFVAVTAKIKPNEYNENVYFNLAPESINVVDEATYDIWTKETEYQTAARMVEK